MTFTGNMLPTPPALKLQPAGLCALAPVHVVLLIQHVTSMRQIVKSFVAPLAPPFFSTFSYKRRDFRKEVTEYKMRVLIFSTNFV
jgi:hypothetical protein